ncbi:MAG TPA: SDR family NAD-dependent epimerase/dehydratase [Rhodospirillales bacterium]|nr:SDR family NAD-dependent epimerase/dehydratase [Rhodospirillales bacterium]
MSETPQNVLVIGGAGYVGAVLVPELLEKGHRVTVLDLFIYGDDVLPGHPALTLVKGDMRDIGNVEQALAGCEAVIHLACISNDPSFELDPELGKSINYDSFRPIVQAAKRAGVSRFVYASSSSVYGIKEGVDVTEDLALEPLTDYSKFKVMCEEILHQERAPGFHTTIIRPATVCGYSPRQRLDVIVNILTNHAVNNGKVRVFGGPQLRPNIHIRDMCRVYHLCLELPAGQVDGGVYNVGFENHSVLKLAEIVCEVVGDSVEMSVEPTDDPRSYHVSSERIKREIGFKPEFSIEQAVRDLKQAFEDGRLHDPLNNPLYFNIKRMQDLNLK